MPATTTYGSWNNHVGGSNARLEDDVAGFLGEFAGDYDVPGLVAAYREAINAALPEGVSLHGDEFYGPWPVSAKLVVDMGTAIEGIDLGALAEQFDTSDQPAPVKIYEDNSGSVYLARTATQGWALGPVTPDMRGLAHDDANGWWWGTWEPSAAGGQSPAELGGLVHIATWTREDGLTIERDGNGNPVAGAGGRTYLGIAD